MEISTVLNEEKKIRKLLHEVPELSGCEVKTKRIIDVELIQNFIKSLPYSLSKDQRLKIKIRKIII